METGGIVAEYAYRANGLRQSKTVNGVTTTHIWDGSNIISDLINGAVANKYYRGIGLIGADLGGARNYYLYNAHGDVTSLTNTAGVITQKYDYDAFGNLRDMAGYSTDNDANPFRYCGEYFDEETGTIYLRARYYDPSTGRFTQEDIHWNPGNMIYGDNPLKWNIQELDEGDPLGLNMYVYAPNIQAVHQSNNLYVYGLNNPLKWIDPSGENTEVLRLWTTTAWPIIAVDGVLPIGDVIYVAGLGICVIIDGVINDNNTNILEARAGSGVTEHTKGARPSTKGKHEQGQARKQKDGGGEKGDARRKPNPNKRRP